jgi:uncharacterized protein YjbJ (UPF0337 family)
MKTISSSVPMSEEEIRGRRKQIKGKVREEIGKLSGNKTEQLKGKIEQAEGKARENIGRFVRKTRSDSERRNLARGAATTPRGARAGGLFEPSLFYVDR